MKASMTVKIDIERVPEVIAAMRTQMANMLREAAVGEPDIVSKKLHAIAADFEVGGTS